jgi:phosphoesterase RecJ-like protein
MKEVCRAIRRGRNFLLCAHVRPEGDSIGSLLAIQYLLRHLSKRPLIVSQDAFPVRLDVLPKDGWTTLRDLEAMKRKPRFDTCVVVDCPNPKRLGRVHKLIRPGMTVINIDHHVSNARFGDYNLVNDRASACGEIAYELFKTMRVPIGPEAALAMYVSISTDTGSFRFGNTTTHTHRIVAELLKTGIDHEHINENLYDRSSHRRVSLLAHILKNLKIELGGKVVWAVIRKELLRRTRTTVVDTEGFIDFLRSVAGVHIAFILIENGKNRFHVSFRAKGRNDVNQIAEAFGGGGHRKSAGCRIEGPPEQAAQRILGVVRNYLKKPTFS